MGSKIKNWYNVLKHNRKKLLISLLFLIISLTLFGLSGNYVTDNKNTAISPDLILDHFGPYNLSFIFIWLFIVVICVFFLHFIFWRPNELSHALNMFCLFMVTRSGFIIFTHLRVPPDAIQVHFPFFVQFLSFSNDLFFSGHTGLPFLIFLMLRHRNKKLSYFMLASSIVLAITALLMHVHYSIDVFSAYFITYGIYRFGNRYIQR